MNFRRIKRGIPFDEVDVGESLIITQFAEMSFAKKHCFNSFCMCNHCIFSMVGGWNEELYKITKMVFIIQLLCFCGCQGISGRHGFYPGESECAFW